MACSHTHGHYHACYPWGPYYYPPQAYYYPYPSVCHGSVAHHPKHCSCHACCGGKAKHTVVPQEAVVDGSAPVTAIVGGIAATRPRLEYMPVDGATAAAVQVTIEDADGTFSWDEDAVAEGYHVKDDLPMVAPGGVITLQTTEAVARLRWGEMMAYEFEKVEE